MTAGKAARQSAAFLRFGKRILNGDTRCCPQEDRRLETMFDILSVTLFIAAASLFFLRFRHEDPPLAPYVIVSLVAALGNWVGNNAPNAYVALSAIALIIAGAFYTLHLASEPYREGGAKGR